MATAFLVAAVVAALSATAEIKVEKLGDDLWRVRMARDGKWPESGMNRYGVFADLPAVEASGSLDGVKNGDAHYVVRVIARGCRVLV